MRGSTVILNVILLHFIFIPAHKCDLCCNVDVNKDCMFGKKLSQIPVPLTRGHLQCRDTFVWPDRCPYKTGVPTRQVLLYMFVFFHAFVESAFKIKTRMT